jgi:hypothetical protein
VRAGNIGEAMFVASEILKASAGFYKLIFGGSVAAVTMTEEDLEGVEGDLNRLYDEVATPPKAMATPNAVDPALILMIVDVVLKLIAERRKQK